MNFALQKEKISCHVTHTTTTDVPAPMPERHKPAGTKQIRTRRLHIDARSKHQWTTATYLLSPRPAKD